MRQRRPPPHGTRGSTGVVGGVEGLAPLTPCRQPRRLPDPDAGLKPLPKEKKRDPFSSKKSTRRVPQEKILPAGRSTSREKTRHPSEPGREGDPRNAGAPQQARISPAKREDARRLAPAASGGQGTRHATATPATTRDKGEYGGRRGCRGARPSHPLPPAAQATRPGRRAEAATQRKIKKKKGETTKPRCRTEAASPSKKKRKKPPCPAGRPADGAAGLAMRRFSILLNKSALGRGWGAWGEGEPLPRRRRPKGGPQGRAR